MMFATPTAMLEQTLKSSRLYSQMQKLHVDFHAKSSIGSDMAFTDDEIDPIKVRTGLFALITARLEDVHEVGVKGQATKIGNQNIGDLIVDLRSMLDEIDIQIDAIDLLHDL